MRATRPEASSTRRVALASAALTAALAALAWATPTAAATDGSQAERPERPRLLVFVVVDQLSGESLPALRERLAAGGFRRFLERGAFYAGARFEHAGTFTGPGHATLHTGASPDAHGIVGNAWYDRESGRQVYCIEDPADAAVRSAARLRVPTLADALDAATAGASRTVVLSLKDRAAVLPAGDAGTAVWYDASTGRFAASRTPAPDWVARFNAAGGAEPYASATWSLSEPGATYAWACGPATTGCVPARCCASSPFREPSGEPDLEPPYAIGSAEHPLAALRYSPYADVMTLDLARAAIVAERLGRDDAPDLLGLSLSALDYVGHAFGSESVEYEDHVLKLDAELERFFGFLDATLGPGSWGAALASDHGVAPIPEQGAALARPGGRVPPEAVEANVRAALALGFGDDARDLPLTFASTGIYVDLDAIASRGLDARAVLDAVRGGVESTPGIARAWIGRDLAAAVTEGDPLALLVARSYDPDRSGDVLAVTGWGWLATPYERGTTHGSPHDYDRHVPLALYGPGVVAHHDHRRLAARRLAPTIAHWLGLSGFAPGTPPLPGAFRPSPTRDVPFDPAHEPVAHQ